MTAYIDNRTEEDVLAAIERARLLKERDASMRTHVKDTVIEKLQASGKPSLHIIPQSTEALPQLLDTALDEYVSPQASLQTRLL
jgi:hypothetical protein